jgi:hypothetical protein
MAKAEESSGFMQTVDWAAEKAQLTGNMAIMDHFNFDVGIPKVAENRGVPASWMNGADTVAKTRADRMKQAQTQQMIDAAPAIASTAKTASGLMAGA